MKKNLLCSALMVLAIQTVLANPSEARPCKVFLDPEISKSFDPSLGYSPLPYPTGYSYANSEKDADFSVKMTDGTLAHQGILSLPGFGKTFTNSVQVSNSSGVVAEKEIFRCHTTLREINSMESCGEATSTIYEKLLEKLADIMTTQQCGDATPTPPVAHACSFSRIQLIDPPQDPIDGNLIKADLISKGIQEDPSSPNVAYVTMHEHWKIKSVRHGVTLLMGMPGFLGEDLRIGLDVAVKSENGDILAKLKGSYNSTETWTETDETSKTDQSSHPLELLEKNCQ